MSSNATLTIQGARVSKEMTYTPAYTKAGTGTNVQQKLVIPVIVNHPGYTVPETGEQVKGDTVNLLLTAWGSTADNLAKYLKIGKEFDATCKVNSYVSKIMDSVTNRPILNSAGQEATTLKNGYTIIPGTVRFGEDSAKAIAKEIGEGLRPVGYDGTIPVGMLEVAVAQNDVVGLMARAKQGPAAWENIRNNLKALKYTPGMEYFGNAKVVPARDAVPPNVPGMAAAIAQATKTVDGFTYSDMIGAGWTDEALLTADGGKWAVLVPKKAPAPPATNATAVAV